MLEAISVQIPSTRSVAGDDHDMSFLYTIVSNVMAFVADTK
jgi:hypothetical protein